MNELGLIGYGPFFAAQAELLNDSNLVAARVAADARDIVPIIGSTATWARPSGRLRHAIQAGDAERPVVGDWLLIADEPGEGIIHHVLDRRTALRRRAVGRATQAQVIAANVDVFFVVTSIGRDFNLRRVERYLSAVWDSGASPVIVLNKIDLEQSCEAQLQGLGEVALAVPTVAVSAHTGVGLDALKAHVGQGCTAAFIGSSGVGKSTLVNRLLERERQPTSPLGVSGRGQHTTSRRELIALSSGGALIDTPGIREFGLLELDGLDTTFADIVQLAQGCHFTDCTHTGEPGCAVNEAAAASELLRKRLESYLRLRQEAEAAQKRRSTTHANNSKKRWKSIHRSAKSFLKNSEKHR